MSIVAKHKTPLLVVMLAFILSASAAAQTAMRDYAYEFMLSENYRAALSIYEELTRAQPEDGHLADEYAYCLWQNKKYGKAVKAYKKAAELYSQSTEENAPAFRTDSLINCGEIYLSQKKPKKALKEFAAVYEEDVTDQNVLLGIVASYIRLGYAKEAAAFCEKYIRQCKENYAALAPLYLYWAQCQYALGNKDEAAQGILSSGENYLRAGLPVPTEELDRLYTQFCSD